ncbi:hypothetical protein [Endozoicomonas sp. ALD040]|uniref:hypothetical protein n=1 Tax=Endozoicomonas sp. ALD040 TaxID=3403079 RepID=UPI003BAE2520
MESIQSTKSGPTEDKTARLSGGQAAYALTRSVTPYDHEKKLRHPEKKLKN